MTKRHQNMIARARRQLDTDGRLKDSTRNALQREAWKLDDPIYGGTHDNVIDILSDLLANG